MKARAVLDATQSEKQFMETVIDYARARGWLVYHPYISKKSTSGWPDLALVRRGVLILAELKRQHEKPSAAQAEWLRELGLVVQQSRSAVRVHLWRPSDWPAIERALT